MGDERQADPAKGIIVGISDHGGWAVCVLAASDGSLLDRRRIELVDESLPAIPHHHEAQLLRDDEAVALVARVRASAETHAAAALASLHAASPQLSGIALRRLQPLPATVIERIRDVRARNVADWVMYRQALAEAAQERGLRVHWFDPPTIEAAAASALGVERFDEWFLGLRKSVGPPWNSDHRMALAASIAAAAVALDGRR